MKLNRLGLLFVIVVWTLVFVGAATFTDPQAAFLIGGLLTVAGLLQMAFFAFNGTRRRLGKLMLLAGVITLVVTISVSIGAGLMSQSSGTDSKAVIWYRAGFEVIVLISAHLHAFERVPKDRLAGVRPWFVNKR